MLTQTKIAQCKSNLTNSNTIINMPQSMTVFNLKEISSKLKNFKTISSNLSDTTSPRKINLPPKPNSSTASVILSVLNNQKQTLNFKESEANNQSTDLNNNYLQMNLDTNPISLNVHEDINETKKDNEIHEEEKEEEPCQQKLIEPSEQQVKNNLSQEKQQTSNLPYHYSDHENLYICNLCNCTYDSLRSIKAHLWKHSGHHELSYPIHDYNNRENSNVIVQNKQPALKNQSLYIPNLGNFFFNNHFNNLLL